MHKVKVAELKNNLSRYLEHVRAGGTVLVLHRDRPVARIIPVSGETPGRDDRLEDLERLGLIRRGKGGMRAWLRRHRPVKVPGGSLVEDFLDERRSGW